MPQRLRRIRNVPSTNVPGTQPHIGGKSTQLHRTSPEDQTTQEDDQGGNGSQPGLRCLIAEARIGQGGAGVGVGHAVRHVGGQRFAAFGDNLDLVRVAAARAGGLVGALKVERDGGACRLGDAAGLHRAVAFARGLRVDLKQLPAKMHEAHISSFGAFGAHHHIQKLALRRRAVHGQFERFRHGGAITGRRGAAGLGGGQHEA